MKTRKKRKRKCTTHLLLLLHTATIHIFKQKKMEQRKEEMENINLYVICMNTYNKIKRPERLAVRTFALHICITKDCVN